MATELGGQRVIVRVPGAPAFVSPPRLAGTIVVPAHGVPGEDGPAGPPGPPGPPGEPGGAFLGSVLWTGDGTPPEVIQGAKPGDRYLDTVTGMIYTLG